MARHDSAVPLFSLSSRRVERREARKYLAVPPFPSVPRTFCKRGAANAKPGGALMFGGAQGVVVNLRDLSARLRQLPGETSAEVSPTILPTTRAALTPLATMGAADTETAARLDAALEAGATWAWCPTGALDLAMADGRLWLLAPAKVARMMAAGLLPKEIEANLRDTSR